jgi:chromosome segregation ATPase
LAQEAASTPSLGDLARQVRAQREKSAQKPAKVFTNDNLPARPSLESATPAPGLSATTPEQKETKSEASTTEEKPTEGAHDEAYYRKRSKELQNQLDLHRRELAVLEQKAGDQQNIFYTDPNKTLQQSSTPAYVADAKKLQDEIAKKKGQIADDQKALDDLRDQLRREGGNAGWLR